MILYHPLVAKEVEKLRPWLAAADNKSEYCGDTDRWALYYKGEIQGGAHPRLRFDYETTKEQIQSGNHTTGFVDSLIEDLSDLVLNGDVYSNYPILNAMDGEIKRGKDALEFDIFKGALYTEYRADVVWITVYLIVYVRFE